MDFLGNISLRLVGALCTIGILAAAYFFIVKPAADTTKDTVNAISKPLSDINESVKQAEQQAQAAQAQAAEANGGGSTSATGSFGGVNIGKLQSCMAKASKTQNVTLVQKCAEKYGAGAIAP